MGRIRTIKPSFFRHEGLQELQASTAQPVMLVFAGLLTVVDREGRFIWKPKTLKLDVLPFLDYDLAESLTLLADKGFLRAYEIAGAKYGDIPTFLKHQVINAREADSSIPPFDPTCACTEIIVQAQEQPVHARGEGKGREGNKEEEGKGNRKGNGTIAASDKPLSAEGSPTFIVLLITKPESQYPVTEAQITEWKTLYPAVDIRQELRNMRGWCEANPKKLKHLSGVQRFIHSWLRDKQNKGGAAGFQSDSGGYKPSPDRHNHMKKEPVFLEPYIPRPGERSNAYTSPADTRQDHDYANIDAAARDYFGSTGADEADARSLPEPDDNRGNGENLDRSLDEGYSDLWPSSVPSSPAGNVVEGKVSSRPDTHRRGDSTDAA